MQSLFGSGHRLRVALRFAFSILVVAVIMSLAQPVSALRGSSVSVPIQRIASNDVPGLDGDGLLRPDYLPCEGSLLWMTAWYFEGSSGWERLMGWWFESGGQWHPCLSATVVGVWPHTGSPVRASSSALAVAGEIALATAAAGSSIDSWTNWMKKGKNKLAASIFGAPLAVPVGVASDKQHNLYVSNSGVSGPASVLEYAAGSTTPSRTIFDPAAGPSSAGITVDGAGDVFWAFNNVSGAAQLDEISPSNVITELFSYAGSAGDVKIDKHNNIVFSVPSTVSGGEVSSSMNRSRDISLTNGRSTVPPDLSALMPRTNASTLSIRPTSLSTVTSTRRGRLCSQER